MDGLITAVPITHMSSSVPCGLVALISTMLLKFRLRASIVLMHARLLSLWLQHTRKSALTVLAFAIAAMFNFYPHSDPISG